MVFRVDVAAGEIDVGADAAQHFAELIGPLPGHRERRNRARATPFGGGVHRKVEDGCGLQQPVDDALDLTGGLFEHQEIVGAEEHDTDRLHDAGIEHRRDLERGIEDLDRNRVGRWTWSTSATSRTAAASRIECCVKEGIDVS